MHERWGYTVAVSASRYVSVVVTILIVNDRNEELHPR